MEKLTKKLKSEILESIYDLEINSEDFEHQIEDCITTYAKHTYNIETYNIDIKIELQEEVLWDDNDYYDRQDLKVTELVVLCRNGLINTDRLSDAELEKHLR